MQSFNLAKAVFLAVTTVAAGYAAAESSGRSDSVPARPNHESIAERSAAKSSDCCSRQEGDHDHSGMMMEGGDMMTGDMMARCKEMHEQMHEGMKQKDDQAS